MKDNMVRNVLIISVVLIGIAISIGFSFAYFTANIKGNENAEPMKVEAGTMELTFTEGDNNISLPNAQPGDKQSKTFSVQNTGTLDDEYNYNIKLVGVETNIIKRDLKYILEECEDSTCSSVKADGVKEEGYINTDSVKNKEMYLAVDIPRPENTQFHYYKLTIDFQELNIDQSYNREATFVGKLNVDTEKDKKVYEQAPNKPELYQGLIPVKYGTNGEVIIADPEGTDWYNYDNNEWGNAVLVTDAKYKELTENNQLKTEAIGKTLNLTTDSNSDILQMYVWIPRYRYKLFNANSDEAEEQEIEIEFEKDTETTGNVRCTIASNGKETCKNDTNGNWYTHPAFTFGSTELSGIWVGKFESSHTTKSDLTGINAALNCINDTCIESDNIRIIPNVTSLRYNTTSSYFYVSRSLEKPDNIYNLDSKQIDTHMIKNMEWGAMAYLTNSKYGRCTDNKCENVTVNVRHPTGYAEQPWNTSNGILASTTRNMYGIYDTSGNYYEYIMGLIMDSDGSGPSLGKSEFSSIPSENKYYDLYEYAESNFERSKGHLGDATRETFKSIDSLFSGWYDVRNAFPNSTTPWFERGGDWSGKSGPFSYNAYYGIAYGDISFRIVLTKQDGNK